MCVVYRKKITEKMIFTDAQLLERKTNQKNYYKHNNYTNNN